MNCLFLINERSGARRRRNMREILRASPYREAEVIGCGSKDELDGIAARAEKDGVEVIFAIGGDGTVHETAKRLIGRPVALGVIPTGSGNGFARHLGIPLDPATALTACEKGAVVTIDTATASGEPFVGVMGVGFDAVIAERFASSRVRGLGAYLAAGLQAFTSHRAERFSLELGNQTIEDDASVVAVANICEWGNNARLAPSASVTDGLLDVVIIPDIRWHRVPRLMAHLFRGTFDKVPGVRSIRTESIVIRRERAAVAQLDGEPLPLPATIEIRVRPRSLRVLVPDPRRRL